MNPTRFIAFWNPFEEVTGYPGAEFFSELFQQTSGIIYMDLKHNSDIRSRQIIESADLAVIFLKQDGRSLDRFFSERQICQENVFYCIYNYFREGTPDMETITMRYRIPQNRLAVLPYNCRLGVVKKKGHLEEYLRKKDIRYVYEAWSGFFHELEQTEEKLERILLDLSEK